MARPPIVDAVADPLHAILDFVVYALGFRLSIKIIFSL